MGQPEQMADLVHRLRRHPLLRGPRTLRVAQPRHRHHRYTGALAGQPEYEVETGRVQIDIGQPQGQAVLGPHPLEQRSEEHTSELQSLRHLVCSLLLEKNKIENFKRTSVDLVLDENVPGYW